MKKNFKGLAYLLISFTIFGLVLVGEVKCIIKAVKCDWEPIGKAEIFYSLGAITGTGCIIGYIDIEDSKKELK